MIRRSTIQHPMSMTAAVARHPIADFAEWASVSGQWLTHSPRPNRYRERLLGSVRREYLERVVIFGEGHQSTTTTFILRRPSD